MSWILTRSGKHFDFADPQPDQVDIIDIAWGLAKECRFAGQCMGFYSVAQHSVLVSEIVPAELALEGLLHDASEAYCKDIPMPLKAMLPDYKAIEQRVDRAIRAAFGLPEVCSPEIKRADIILLATERRDLMPHDPAPWAILEGVAPLPKQVRPISIPEALDWFMQNYIDLRAMAAVQ
ncbi:metal-dependent phosphohydrolase [Thiobacillus sp.]|uniref:metal-dependent phosphohydrolase n=1 Tax=Thiobacillus sp. TaxID=924 RepID=UPI0017E47889|nr:metal-dependent phosphohydrolase [Thiobacillus sp.]MBC2731353.1 HD family hydrolase [Thiobacillus sp.]MBC2740089.1 HD family hydrolase [Thiobacillus sp.]MBC2758301.1 HD family hydrolase [Thiobacillus sp.]